MAKSKSAVEIEGLKGFQKHLKSLGPEMTKELKTANFEVASEVKNDAQALADSLGGVAAKAAQTLKASKVATGAVIKYGGPKAPYAFGAEFGSLRYKQFPAWRGRVEGLTQGNAGYFLFPTVRDDQEKISALYLSKLSELADKAFTE
jgi:hypothetical protein